MELSVSLSQVRVQSPFISIDTKDYNITHIEDASAKYTGGICRPVALRRDVTEAETLCVRGSPSNTESLFGLLSLASAMIVPTAR
jgi:hypothetical protein